MLGVIVGGALAGLALGMLGAGGTIIGLPMFLYLGGPQGHAAFGTNALGVTAIAVVLLAWRMYNREINLVHGVVFAIPGLFGIAIGARLGLIYPAAKLVFLLSFLILIVAVWIGYLSTQNKSIETEEASIPSLRRSGQATSIERRHILRIMPTAFTIGVISGFFAIGGGFLVVPGLAIAAAIDLRHSARSSLLPIAAFAGLDAIEYIHAGHVQFAASGVMIVAGLVGGAVGLVLGDRLPLRIIQRAFAVFLALVAIYMIAQNVTL
jgi:hypothetical protein